jgi:peptide/nickel transport system substrate-binding protein
MKKMISIFFILLVYFFASCDNKTNRDQEGLIVYQENQISWTRNFEPLNPVSICRWPTRGGIYEPLYIYNPISTEWVPWLATNYEWKNDNRKLLFSIRTGVKWSDGREFSAYDVAYTLNLWKQFPALDTRNAWDYLQNVVAISDTLVEVDFKRVYVPGFEAIAGAYIVPKHIWSKLDDPLKFDNPDPVGTGPYTEVLRFNSQVWELGKNHNYWQKGKPYVEKLIFPTFSTNEQTTLALLSGNLDWAGAFIPAIQRIFVDKNPEHHHYWFRNTGYSTFLHTNTKDPILQDTNVRKAISYAINREQVVKVGMYNYTSPAHVTSLAGPMAKWHSPKINEKENWTAFNLEKANELLDNAGYKWKNKNERIDSNGSPLKFNIIVVSGWSDWVRSAQVISQNLKKVGIQATVRTYDFGAWIARMQQGNFQMAVGWADKGATPYNFFKSMMFSEYVKPLGETADINWHRFGIKEADFLIKEFEQTSDENKIKNIIYKLQHLFIEHAPGIPLFAELSWAECNSKYFTNFPSAENPYGPLSVNEQPSFIFTLLNIKKR